MAASDNPRARNLYTVTFDPRLKTYVYIAGILFCIVSIIGIVVLPVWLIAGRRYINKYYDNLYCELTTRALHFKKGVWFQVERTVPLDKIQDLTFREGPVLRFWGLTTLKLETAGQSTQGSSDMGLTGIVDSRKFREMVLNQRDNITDFQSARESSQSQTSDSALLSTLNDIHSTLKSIESKLNN